MRSRTKLAVLGLFYFVQGLPAGFQGRALQLHLRGTGWSRAAVGFVAALSLPWLLKPLWAPLVDRFGSRRFGRKKSWIVPLTALLALTSIGAALVADRSLPALLALVALMNLAAATQDIAVDGLAVDLLGPGDLGHGNAAQVAGYKVGMIMCGGLLLWSVGDDGLATMLVVMSVMITLVLGVALALREPPPRPTAEPPRRLREAVKLTLSYFLRPEHRFVLAACVTYKLGEAMCDSMFKLYLQDHGIAPSTLGLWQGVYGMTASITGSLVGGLVASRLPLVRALGLTAILRVGPLVALVLLSAGVLGFGNGQILGVIVAEDFFGGALTTVMFAVMMASVDPRVGATQFTVLAAIEVWGKAPAGASAGLVADSIGYTGTFALGAILSAAFVALVPALRRDPRLARRPGADW